MNPEIVQSQSWRYKTIVVIKRQQQTTISNKAVYQAAGARCTEELQGTQSEHKTNRVKMNPEIVQSQSWRYKTIVVIKRQQQTTISNKYCQLSRGATRP